MPSSPPPRLGSEEAGKELYIFFTPPPTGWSTTNQKRTKLVAFDAETWDQFATSVSIQGDYIAVGAREDDDHGYSTGATYFYQNSGSAWTFMEKIVPDAVEEWNYLGSCVLAHNGYIYTGTYKKMQLTGRKKVDTNGLVVAEEIKLEEGAKLKLENGDIRIEPFNPKI
jgi:hypothetical protein